MSNATYYNVTMSCGHVDAVMIAEKGARRDEKIRYLENAGVCRKCQAKEMREKREKEAETKPFQFNALILPDLDFDTKEIQVFVWFSGNAKPHKDEIKSLGGYHWGATPYRFGWLQNPYELYWGKTIDYRNLEEERKKAVSIGVQRCVLQKEESQMNLKTAQNEKKRLELEKNKFGNLVQPALPEFLKGRWNQKVYGRSGNYSVYLDNEKLDITDEQKEEIEQYLKDKEEYKRKVEEIKNS